MPVLITTEYEGSSGLHLPDLYIGETKTYAVDFSDYGEYSSVATGTLDWTPDANCAITNEAYSVATGKSAFTVKCTTAGLHKITMIFTSTGTHPIMGAAVPIIKNLTRYIMVYAP